MARKKIAGELVYKSRMEGAGQMEGEATRAERSLTGMEKATGGASSGLITLKGAVMAAGGAFAASKLLGYMREGVELATKLEKKSSHLASTIRILGGDAEDVKNLTTQFRGLAIAYGQASPEGVLDTYEQMITTSYDMVGAQREIETVLKANVVGWGENEELVERAARAMETFKLRTEDTADILAGYEVAATKGHIETDTLVKVIEKEAPTLQQINAGFAETVGLISALSSTGLGGRKVVAGLGQMLNVLAAQTGPVADELQRVGVVTGEGIIPALEALAAKQDEVDWYKIAPDVATQNLLKTAIDNLDLVKERIADIPGAAALLEEAYKDAADDGAYASAIMSAGLQEIKRSAGEALISGVIPLATGLGEGATASETLTKLFAYLAVAAYDLTHALVGMEAIGLTNVINGFKMVGLSAKAMYYEMTLQFDKAEETLEELGEVAKAGTKAYAGYFEGFRGGGWVEELFESIGDKAKGSKTNVDELLRKLKELSEAPPAPGGPPKAPARAAAPEIPRVEKPMWVEPGVPLEEIREERKIQITTEPTPEELGDEFGEKFDEASAAIGRSLAADIRAAIMDGADVGDIFANRLGNAVEAALSDAIRLALGKMAIGQALSQIPIIGPFLGAFLGLQHGGLVKPLTPGVPAMLAEGGRPEVAFPLDTKPIYEVSRALDMVARDMYTPADIATLGGPREIGGKPSVNVMVQGVDPLGLAVYEMQEIGAAATLAKTV
jgi:hypothetical protein